MWTQACLFSRHKWTCSICVDMSQGNFDLSISNSEVGMGLRCLTCLPPLPVLPSLSCYWWLQKSSSAVAAWYTIACLSQCVWYSSWDIHLQSGLVIHKEAKSLLWIFILLVDMSLRQTFLSWLVYACLRKEIRKERAKLPKKGVGPRWMLKIQIDIN